MYRVHLDSGANQGETPGIGESPSNQPISGLVIFSKRQALSRAVVVNSNISRGKYLPAEGAWFELRPQYTCKVAIEIIRRHFVAQLSTALSAACRSRRTSASARVKRRTVTRTSSTGRRVEDVGVPVTV